MSLRIALLGLLSDGPASGYDLSRRVDNSVSHVWHARHSQIYPELAKLAADGLIAVEAEGPRGRKIYRITEAGSAELRHWILDHTPTTSVRSEWALQAFLLPILAPPEALAVLERMRESSQAMLENLASLQERFVAKAGPGNAPLGFYALDLGVRQIRSLVEWVDDTAEEVRRRAGEAGPQE